MPSSSTNIFSQNRPKRRSKYDANAFGMITFTLALFLFIVGLVFFGVTTAYGSDATASLGDTKFGSEARGLVRSAARVEVQTDLIAPVAKAPFLEGARFKKGESLISFSCGRYWAEINAAKASRRAAGIDLNAKRQLLKYKAAGKAEVQQAQAEVARTGAEVEALKARAQDCVIKAPFNGRVVSLNTRVHEMPKQNQPLIIIIDDTRLELELVVPSNWLTWLRPGAHFDFRVDETGLTHNAIVDRLGAEVDPVSQTIRIVGRFPEFPDTVLAGMSGLATFNAVSQ